MKHTYKVTGMSCDSCRTKVEKALNEINGITKAAVTLPDSVVVEMDTHIATETMQEALTKVGNYTIEVAPHHPEIKSEVKESSSCCGGDHSSKKEAHQHHHQTPKQKDNGTYYCPMHCEGEKTYDKPGDCPVCGCLLYTSPSPRD